MHTSGVVYICISHIYIRVALCIVPRHNEYNAGSIFFIITWSEISLQEISHVKDCIIALKINKLDCSRNNPWISPMGSWYKAGTSKMLKTSNVSNVPMHSSFCLGTRPLHASRFACTSSSPGRALDRMHWTLRCLMPFLLSQALHLLHWLTRHLRLIDRRHGFICFTSSRGHYNIRAKRQIDVYATLQS